MSTIPADDDRDPVRPEEVREFYERVSHEEEDGIDPFLDGLRFDRKFLTENGISPK